MTAPRSLFVVRMKMPSRVAIAPPEPPNTDGGMLSLFPSREEAEAFQLQCEQEIAGTGNWVPLLWLGSFSALLELSDFDEPIFLDWMQDNDIPHPDSVQPTEWESAWQVWLMQLGRDRLERLYDVLHRFRFCEVLEIPYIEGDYPPQQREDWEAAVALPDLPPRPEPIAHDDEVPF
jgi:hypothetical protein